MGRTLDRFRDPNPFPGEPFRDYAQMVPNLTANGDRAVIQTHLGYVGTWLYWDGKIQDIGPTCMSNCEALRLGVVNVVTDPTHFSLDAGHTLVTGDIVRVCGLAGQAELVDAVATVTGNDVVLSAAATGILTNDLVLAVSSMHPFTVGQGATRQVDILSTTMDGFALGGGTVGWSVENGVAALRITDALDISGRYRGDTTFAQRVDITMPAVNLNKVGFGWWQDGTHVIAGGIHHNGVDYYQALFRAAILAPTVVLGSTLPGGLANIEGEGVQNVTSQTAANRINRKGFAVYSDDGRNGANWLNTTPSTGIDTLNAYVNMALGTGVVNDVREFSSVWSGR